MRVAPAGGPRRHLHPQLQDIFDERQRQERGPAGETVRLHQRLAQDRGIRSAAREQQPERLKVYSFFYCVLIILLLLHEYSLAYR